MQLSVITFLCILVFLANEVKAQARKISGKKVQQGIQKDSAAVEKVAEDLSWKTIDVNFLSSYYQQDGNNGAVTGGIGTEQLTDFTQKVIVKVPLNKKTTFKMDGGYDYYSSASTDNIDNIRSSDSASDVRVHGNIGLSHKVNDQNQYGGRIGFSTEYDYNSFQAGMNFARLSKDENRSFQMSGQVFIDQWALIYPIELRRSAQAPTNNRQSYNLAVGYAQVINKRTQVQLMAEAVYMNGLLSTPFHRVYFQESAGPLIEHLPGTRLKVPVGARVNYYISNRMILRLYTRGYWDNWGILANTSSIELPFKLNRFMAIYPHYRVHAQTAADYFKPYKEHTQNSEFYTSDYDLSALTSRHYGIGFMYSPPDGLFKVKRPFKPDGHLRLSSIDVKYSHYDRSTGLTADIVSFGFGVTID
jgi:hypothetical protein